MIFILVIILVLLFFIVFTLFAFLFVLGWLSHFCVVGDLKIDFFVISCAWVCGCRSLGRTGIGSL